MKFKDYLILKEHEDRDVKRTLEKIPKKHSDLVRDYKIVFQKSNTLKGDKNHIGLIDEKEKTITIAAPWNFSREFTILHEIAHAVYAKMEEKAKEQWSQIIKNNIKNQIKKNPQAKDSLKQNPEEIFCNCYANFYCKHKNSTYENPNWKDFIEKISI